MCLAIQSAEATEQAAQIIFQAPSASWSWQNQITPFSDTTFWIVVALVITIIFTFGCFAWLPSITRQVAKPFPNDHHQKTEHVIYYLNLEEEFQKHDEGIPFLSTPQEIALGGDRREG